MFPYSVTFRFCRGETDIRYRVTDLLQVSYQDHYEIINYKRFNETAHFQTRIVGTKWLEKLLI